MDVIYSKLASAVGIIVFIALAACISTNRKHIDKRLVLSGIGLQVVLAFLILGIPEWGIPGILYPAFEAAKVGVTNLILFTQQGTQFLFGAQLLNMEQSGFIFALQVLPTIIFISSLMAILYHLGIMQLIVKSFSWIMYKTLRVSGAEATAASANVFVGQTEAPLMIRPFVKNMTNSELFMLMVGGMATVAGGVLAGYVAMLQEFNPDIAIHLLTASVLSAPAAIVVAKVMIPEDPGVEPETKHGIPKSASEKIDSNIIEAAARGASEGLKLAINVGGMLLAFLALIYMADAILVYFGELIGFNLWGSSLDPFYTEGDNAKLTLSVVFSWLFFPFALLMGIPFDEAFLAGSLLGQKVALNEFVAYLSLAQMGEVFSERTFLILSYALCGFANFASIAIQIGGVGSLAPERRSDLAQMGMKSVAGGCLAAFMTACIANIFI